MKVTIEVDGTSEEVERWMARFNLRDGDGVSPQEIAVDGEVEWSPQIADRLVQRITVDARKALLYLMENAPEVFFEDLQTHLGMNGIQMGGVMASFGFAERAGLPRPYRVDRERRRYVIDREITPILLEAVSRYEERHGRAA